MPFIIFLKTRHDIFCRPPPFHSDFSTVIIREQRMIENWEEISSVTIFIFLCVNVVRATSRSETQFLLCVPSELISRPFTLAWLPDMIPLSAGLPNPALFPFTKATFETQDGQEIVLDGQKMIRALQYSGTPGFPDLIDWLKKLQVSLLPLISSSN